MRTAIDLHAHTHCSDGTLSPARLVALAADVGLEALAVTDHDTLEGIGEAQEAARGKRLTLIPGVEVSAHFSRELHLLGYGVRTGSAIDKALGEQRRNRLLRLEQMLRKLEALGVPIDEERVTSLSREVVGRPHVARAMVEAGYVTSISQAFDKYLGEGRPGYVPTERMSPREIVERILKSRGVAAIAHPWLLRLEDVQFEQLVEALAGYGLEALECYGPGCDAHASVKYAAMARRLGLLALGGSDFHGDNRPATELGSGLEGWTEARAQTDALLERIDRRL